MSNQKLSLEGQAFYASVHTPNQTAGAYVMDLMITDPMVAQVALDAGLQPARKQNGSMVSYDDVGSPVFRAKRKLVSRAGVTFNPPVVVDAATNRMTDKIGNGSKVIVRGTTYDYDVAGRKGTALRLDGVQVLELVEVKSSMFDKKEGFTTNNKSEDII